MHGTCKRYPLHMEAASQIESEEGDRAHPQRVGDARRPVRREPLLPILKYALRPLALLDRNKCLARGITSILAERTIEPVVRKLFENVRSPTGRSRDGKNAGE
jgi:hypothetical protein